jgi:hypothetical protein
MVRAEVRISKEMFSLLEITHKKTKLNRLSGFTTYFSEMRLTYILLDESITFSNSL